MEESITSNLHLSDESGINLISPDKNVPRRKSSIFNRRSSSVDKEKMQTSCEMREKPPSESDFSKENYVTSLKKEICDWEAMYKERKKTRTQARKRYRSPTLLTEEDVFALFNEEDKRFVQCRPDYTSIGKEAIISLEKFSISLQKTMDFEKSLQSIINYANKTETEVRKQIIELSDME